MSIQKTSSILIIFGPTGVGKTDCADLIAEQVPSEIINMDMGQLYTPLTIGTAKPDWRSASIPHHMFDIIDTPRNYSVQEYRDAVIPLIKEIWQRNKLPILVGGSGFYLRSLFFPPRVEDISEYIPDDEKSSEKLWHELYTIDSDRAQQIDRNDAYRIKRALAIWYATGAKPSEYAPRYEPIASCQIICLNRDRQELYARINERVRSMMSEGWLDEVRALMGTVWEFFILNKKIIGYDDLIRYMHASEQTKEDLKRTISIIQKRTRNYAKRQMTYWRMLQYDLIKGHEQYLLEHKDGYTLELDEVNLTITHLEEYINKLLN
jgi:tRNA dimethylallyltransferase